MSLRMVRAQISSGVAPAVNSRVRPSAGTGRNPFKASSVPELVAYLQQNPDKVTAATQGNGATSHLTSEMFQMQAKVKLRNIPYRGSAPALQGLLAGDVDLMFDNLGVSLPLAETLPGFESVAWFAIVAPPGTPKNIVDKINADVNEALRQPEIQDGLRKLSAEVFGGSAEKASRYMRDEIDRWGKVIKAASVPQQ